MRALIVTAHPEPRSFLRALATQTERSLVDTGADVSIIHLNDDAFDPVSDRRNFNTVFDAGFLKVQAEERHASTHDGFVDMIRDHQKMILNADLLILAFPLWWGGMPAIMKGWIDRVFASGVLYGGGRAYETGVLRGKRAKLIVTTGGPEDSFSPDAFGTLEAVLHPIHRCILEYVGYEVLPDFVTHAPAPMSDDERQSELARLEKQFTELV